MTMVRTEVAAIPDMEDAAGRIGQYGLAQIDGGAYRAVVRVGGDDLLLGHNHRLGLCHDHGLRLGYNHGCGLPEPDRRGVADLIRRRAGEGADRLAGKFGTVNHQGA
jgi:hypothetical protein